MNQRSTFDSAVQFWTETKIWRKKKYFWLNWQLDLKNARVSIPNEKQTLGKSTFDDNTRFHCQVRGVLQPKRWKKKKYNNNFIEEAASFLVTS